MSEPRRPAVKGPDLPAGAYTDLSEGVTALLAEARRQAARSVNAILTATYWEIGRRIVEFEQAGERRAEYGEELLARLSRDLTERFGRGFGVDNLERMRAFVQAYPPDQIYAPQSRKYGGLGLTGHCTQAPPTSDAIVAAGPALTSAPESTDPLRIVQTLSAQSGDAAQQIPQTLSAESGSATKYATPSRKSEEAPTEIRQTPSAESARGISATRLRRSGPAGETTGDYLAWLASAFPLSWSHYVRLLAVKDAPARAFHETEALRGGWSVRQLDRQIGTQFYERNQVLAAEYRVALPDPARLEEEVARTRRLLQMAPRRSVPVESHE